MLERLNLIYLEDEEAHSRLGALSLDLGHAKIAAREYQAVLDLKPADPAAAHLGLAWPIKWRTASDRRARRSDLLARSRARF